MKYSFKDDYSEGCHSSILDLLSKTNLEQTVDGNYGLDSYSIQAKELIKTHLNHSDSEIHFVSGGTQANLLVISSLLKPYEAVITVESGHIAVHETGAIEVTGHKVITVAGENGKLNPIHIQEVLDLHHDEHMVIPKLVYISNATELGTIYTKKELTALATYCKDNKLLLYLDGARLGTALTSSKNDLSLEDLAHLTDVFYIGGTKNGALLGEAIIINQPTLQTHFRYATKQRGALLAKGRLLGIQFLGLFQNELFFTLGKHANQQSMKLYNGLNYKGVSFLSEVESNQIFPILNNTLIQQLQKDYSFHIWEKYNIEQSVIRLVTSWATPDYVIETFLSDIENLL